MKQGFLIGSGGLFFYGKCRMDDGMINLPCTHLNKKPLSPLKRSATEISIPR